MVRTEKLTAGALIAWYKELFTFFLGVVSYDSPLRVPGLVLCRLF